MSNSDEETGGSKSLIPQPLDVDLGRCELFINLTCGACKHLERVPHRAYGEVCKNKDITEFSQPCARFSLDSRRLEFKKNDWLLRFAKLMVEAGAEDLKHATAMLNREIRTRKTGFSFGEIVYLRIFPDDYLSNYRSARVVKAEKKLSRHDPATITIEGDTFVATVYASSVLNTVQFKRKRKALKDAGRIKDPKYNSYVQGPSKKELEKRKLVDDLVPTVTYKEVQKLGVVLAREDIKAIPSDIKGGKGKVKERQPDATKDEMALRKTEIDKLITRTRG